VKRDRTRVEPVVFPAGRTSTITLRLSLRSIELIRYVASLTNKKLSQVVEEAVLSRYQHLLNPRRPRAEVITL